jgi:hypothetical protein
MSESKPSDAPVAVVTSSEMMDVNVSELRKAPGAASSEERGPNRKSPTFIQDYYAFGQTVRDHIKYMKKIREKEDATQLETQSVVGLSYTINRVKKFLNMKPLQYVRFVERPFKDLYHEIFMNSKFDEAITPEVIDYWMGMDSVFKILFNTLISIFTYRMNLQNDRRIGKRVDDFFFLNATIQFAFQIHSDDFPTNIEFYQVMVALATLSDEDKNFSIENVNAQLEKDGSPIRFATGNRNLEFFKDRCYGNRQ